MNNIIRFYNVTADTWHMFNVEDQVGVWDIEFDSGFLLNHLIDVSRTEYEFVIVPVISGETRFDLGVNLNDYDFKDIDLLLNAIESSLNVES